MHGPAFSCDNCATAHCASPALCVTGVSGVSISWLGKLRFGFQRKRLCTKTSDQCISARCNPTIVTHVGDPSFWRTATLGGAWTGASRLTIAYVDFTWLRATACSNSPARSSNFLLWYARTALLTAAVCDLLATQLFSLTESAGSAPSLEKTLLLFNKVPKSQPEVEAFVLCVVELCSMCSMFF